MSAPDTNTDKQQKRHKAALLGMGGSVIWAAVLLLLLIIWLAYNGNEPEEEGAQIEVNPGVGATTETSSD